jgi:hypothetical protein
MSVNVTELAAAKWVFGLLDFDNDGACGKLAYWQPGASMCCSRYCRDCKTVRKGDD